MSTVEFTHAQAGHVILVFKFIYYSLISIISSIFIVFQVQTNSQVEVVQL
jgi:hypothetical protein